jgi:hypothetical protein
LRLERLDGRDIQDQWIRILTPQLQSRGILIADIEFVILDKINRFKRRNLDFIAIVGTQDNERQRIRITESPMRPSGIKNLLFVSFGINSC